MCHNSFINPNNHFVYMISHFVPSWVTNIHKNMRLWNSLTRALLARGSHFTWRKNIVNQILYLQTGYQEFWTMGKITCWGLWYLVRSTVRLRFRKSISGHHFQTIRTFANTDFQYHRGVFIVYINTLLQKKCAFFLMKGILHWFVVLLVA